MKKVLIIVVITVLLIFSGAEVIFYIQNQNNPIKKELNNLDPDRITGCTVRWLTMYDEYYEYTETDPVKVRVMYDFFSHMKLKQKKDLMPFGRYYYGIDFIQDGISYPICSYRMGEVLGLYGTKYMADVTNRKELDEEYGWGAVMEEMILNAEKAREERLAEE